MKRVFVAERNGTPIEANEVHVEAVSTLRMAHARMQVTPIPRLSSEKMVPYVSVETLEAFIAEHGGDPELEALIADAKEGL